MALQWMDDFQGYSAVNAAANTLMVQGPYVAASNCTTVLDPQTGSNNVLSLGPVFAQNLRRVLTATQTTIGASQRYYLSALPSATSCVSNFFQFVDTNNKILGYLTNDPSGYLLYYKNSGTTSVLVAQSSSPVITTGSWRHLECKLVLDAAGSIEVRQDGFVVLSASSVNTLGTDSGAINAIAGVSIGSTKTGSINPPSYYIKDFVIWDGTGSNNKDFLGTVQVYRLLPDSDVSLNWTPSTGTTGYNLINELVPDDDTSYIQAPNPSPSPAQFSLSDLPASTTSVKGVMIMHRSKKADSGDAQVQASVISGANTGNGTDRAVSTTYSFWTDMFDQDPSGSSWSKTLVNALKLKLNRTV